MMTNTGVTSNFDGTHAGYFEVMFTQQVANYNQDLAVSITSAMIMNWLMRCQAFAWYFLPPISSILILWW